MTITLTFCGAARTVTGSRYLMETGTARVLVDCGMFQEREHLGLNWENYRINPASVDAVVLTHGHMDHCGWLPKFVKDGFRGPVFATPATADLAPIIVRDIARIQTEDAKTKAKRHAKENRRPARPPAPLYTLNEAEEAIARLRPVKALDTPIPIADGITASWGENGHILGASWIALEAEGKRLVFSGDIGCWNRPILRDPRPPTRADCLIIESTYGNRTHVPGNIEEELEAAARLAGESGGNLLIPSFSVERAQELIYALSTLGEKGRLPQKTVYLDSPMASKIIELFQRHPEVCDREMLARVQAGKSPFAFAGMKYVGGVEESKRLNEIKSGAIIIAGNGMCTGGRIKHHLAQNIGNPRAVLLFVGHQATGTLGRQLLDGAAEIRLFNRPVPVRIRIRRLHSISGHADQRELLRWTESFTEAPAACYVTHGDEEASAALAVLLRRERGWNATTPNMWHRVTL